MIVFKMILCERTRETGAGRAGYQDGGRLCNTQFFGQHRRVYAAEVYLNRTDPHVETVGSITVQRSPATAGLTELGVSSPHYLKTRVCMEAEACAATARE